MIQIIISRYNMLIIYIKLINSFQGSLIKFSLKSRRLTSAFTKTVSVIFYFVWFLMVFFDMVNIIVRNIHYNINIASYCQKTYNEILNNIILLILKHVIGDFFSQCVCLVTFQPIPITPYIMSQHEIVFNEMQNKSEMIDLKTDLTIRDILSGKTKILSILGF